MMRHKRLGKKQKKHSIFFLGMTLTLRSRNRNLSRHTTVSQTQNGTVKARGTLKILKRGKSIKC
jgi:hypothetical protein